MSYKNHHTLWILKHRLLSSTWYNNYNGTGNVEDYVKTNFVKILKYLSLYITFNVAFRRLISSYIFINYIRIINVQINLNLWIKRAHITIIQNHIKRVMDNWNGKWEFWRYMRLKGILYECTSILFVGLLFNPLIINDKLSYIKRYL